MSQLQLIPKGPLSRLRLMVVLVLLAVLAPALVRLWCIKGLVRTIRIDGPSMAETLCGNHFRVTCGDCGITFRCDADDYPDDRRAVCPICGYRENELRDEDLRRGDKVLVDTWPYLWSTPKRGDLVMLVEPTNGESPTKSSFAVKRVAALPQEQPGIQGGDLLAGGQVIRKSLKELREVSVLVHDNHFLPESLSPRQRWLPSPTGTSDWKAIRGGFGFQSTTGHEEGQWLAYEHWHGSASPAPRTGAAPIQDNDNFNQAKARGLNPVRDLLLRCQVQADRGDFMVALQDPPHKLLVHLQLDSRRFLVRKNDSTIISENLPQLTREFVLEAALCDGQLLFAYNRHVLASLPYAEIPVPRDKPIPSGDQPRLQIGAYGGPLQVSHLQVWRDIYYLTPTYLAGDWQAKTPLAEGRFFLLGDNSPVSVDSRQWDARGVPQSSILGKVIALPR